jgi:hypothetical protein
MLINLPFRQLFADLISSGPAWMFPAAAAGGNTAAKCNPKSRKEGKKCAFCRSYMLRRWPLLAFLPLLLLTNKSKSEEWRNPFLELLQLPAVVIRGSSSPRPGRSSTPLP